MVVFYQILRHFTLVEQMLKRAPDSLKSTLRFILRETANFRNHVNLTLLTLATK